MDNTQPAPVPAPAPKPAQPAAFPQIDGYRIEAMIGRGSAGVVYRAVQLAVERKVALKVLHPEIAARGRSVRRLQREARTTAKLAHPGIVTAIDMGQSNGVWWYAMELVDGPSLAERLRKQGAMNEREALRVFIPLCEALEHAFEQGVVHRDIKPSNILIDGTGRARIVDLGLAFAEDDPMLTQQGGTLGTPHYISPEQARNPQAADVRSDIWSLGATLFHCVCGRPPFAGESAAEILSGVLYARIPDPGSIQPELSKSLRLVLRKCLARDPSRRYQHPRELREDLELIRERRQVNVKRGALDPVAGAMSNRARALWILGSAAVVAACALVIWSPWGEPAGPDHAATAEATYAPLEEIATKSKGGRAMLASAITDLDAIRLGIPPQFEARARQLYVDLNAQYGQAVQVERQRFERDLSKLFDDQRDFVGALRLIDDEIEPRLRHELNPGPQQLQELLERTLQVERRRNDVESGLKAALAALESRAKDHYNKVCVASSLAKREHGDWRAARAALAISAADLVRDCGATTRGLPPDQLESTIGHVQSLLVDEKLAEFDAAWRKLDVDLAATLETRAHELGDALDARKLDHACDALRQTWSDALAEAHVAREQMLPEVSGTATATLERLCGDLTARERANDALDARELFEERRNSLEPLWAKRNYDEIAAQWNEAKSFAYFAPEAEAIENQLLEARLLQGVLAAAAANIVELARTHEKVELQIGAIRWRGTLDGGDPLHLGFRLLPSDRAPAVLLALCEIPGEKATLLGRDELEKRAKLSPEGADGTQRLTLALLRWRDGDVRAAREMLPLNPTVPDELRPLVVEATRRIQGSATAEHRAESQRLEEATRLYQLINVVGREHTPSASAEAQVKRIDELLTRYNDLPFVKDIAAELKTRKAELERPTAPVTEKDFVTLFKTPVVLEGGRFTLTFDFDATHESGWSRGEWIAAGEGWQAREAHSREELGSPQLWPTLPLSQPPIALDSAMELEITFQQPETSGAPRLFALTCAGVHVAFAGPPEAGTQGRYAIASGGPEDFGRMIDGLLSARVGVPFAGFERGQRHKIRIELTQSRGAVVVYLDGKPLDSAQVKRPDPRAALGTASIVLRSLEPVRVLAATLTGRISR